jgi:hypothetical protein
MKLGFPAEKVRLKDGVLPHHDIREWELQRIEEGIVSLTHPAVRFTIGVEEDFIDWDDSARLR